MSKRVYVTMADGNTAGSIVMQQGEREDGNHRTTNGATVAEILAALEAAGYDVPGVATAELTIEVDEEPEPEDEPVAVEITVEEVGDPTEDEPVIDEPEETE